jgi:hypothetical protein
MRDMLDAKSIDGRDKGMSWRRGVTLLLTTIEGWKLGLIKTTANTSSQSDLQVAS